MPEVVAAVLATVVPVFALIGLGLVAARRGWLDQAALKGLAFFAFSLAAPALLFSAGLTSRGAGGAAAVAFFAGCLTLYGFVFAIARRWLGLGLGPAALVSLNAGFGNVVAMGIPLTITAYGPAGLETLLGIIGLHSLALVGLTTALLELAAKRGGGGVRALVRVAGAVLANPIVAALLGAILWRALGLPLPPGPVMGSLDLLGRAAPPVALVCLGGGLAQFRVGAGWRDVGLAVTAKLVAMPLLVWLCALMIGLAEREAAVAVTAAALPTGSNPVLLAARYGEGTERAGAAVVVSTTLSVFTLAALVAILR